MCYMGAIPTVVIGDVEWVQQLCIKDFSSFVNLKPITVDSKPFHKSLPTLRDSHWKDVRGILSPTFSGSKMKLMAPIINDCLDPMIRKVTRLNQEGKGLEFKEVYSGFLIDAIGSTAFGLTLNSQENSDDPFLHNARDVIKFRFSIAFLVKMLAPILSPVVNFFNLTTFDRKTLKFFEDVLDHAIELKRAGTVKRVDFLQLMLNAQERTEDDKAEATEEEKQEEEHRAKMSKKTLTADEIKSQGLIFFLAGFETSGTTLGFASYLLATNPEVQDKLVAEIDTLAPSRDDVTYENLTKLTYLEWVISETLRLYPPGFLTTREAGCEYKHKGYTIPKGVQVHFDVWHIHHDPEHWEDPDKFNPERFSPEQREKRHPCAFLPFGAGPRSCIGMRFALLQVKMALVRMLQNFHLETCEETEVIQLV
ncbi:cytochrome P450 3A13-like isoform X2 [Acanthaster planci]|uniref:Thromboxane-A synthase n=1 Tax=Acanthaster planci TaxID=133434 RepID=A0A8B7ZD22_ACAPL|nr:cytochrome P450 3A13-like isoform X2 [Acanthaster planci]